MGIQRMCCVDILLPTSGSVVEVQRLTARAGSAEHIGSEYVTLSLRGPEGDTPTAASGFDPMSQKR